MIPQIQTGYQPEFALGALYHGMNAANTQQSAEMELIKQFLANNREEQMQPMEVGMKGFDFAKQHALHENPNYLPQFVRGQIGEQVQKEMAGNEATRKDDIGKLLQPFVQQQLPIEQGTKTRQLQMQNELAQIDQLLGNGGYDQFGNQASPEQMKAWGGLRQQIVDRMGQTPELSGKTALEHIKGQYGLEEAKLRGQYGVDAANAAGSGTDRVRKQDLDFASMYEKQATALESTLAKYGLKDMDIAALERIINSGNEPAARREEAAEVKRIRTQINDLRNKSLSIASKYLPDIGQPAPQKPTPPANVIRYDEKGNRIQ